MTRPQLRTRPAAATPGQTRTSGTAFFGFRDRGQPKARLRAGLFVSAAGPRRFRPTGGSIRRRKSLRRGASATAFEGSFRLREHAHPASVPARANRKP